jgi:zinc/manganese transport system substrate-binding protein
MVDRTPDGFVRAAGNETEPPPSDVAAFDALLRRGDVVVLVVNAQTTGPVADALRATAERGGVPVVEVRETPPPNTSWIDWQVAQLDALAKAAR